MVFDENFAKIRQSLLRAVQSGSLKEFRTGLERLNRYSNIHCSKLPELLEKLAEDEFHVRESIEKLEIQINAAEHLVSSSEQDVTLKQLLES